jgi:CheY-like chemotaxis protein/anti-sigma regulatory factor (Ser/Thr protein kinase)
LPEIVSDADKCRHIFQNLIGNAIKFTDSGSVEVTARQEGGEICVAVRDTGIGIPEDQLAHIFEEFRQADNSASRKYGGTGLGLTIARRYATLLQGSVTVESEVGKGSTFTVRLPLELKAEAGVAEEAAEGFEASGAAAGLGVAAAGRGQTILLVEDSEPAIIQMTDILSKNGYRVKVARNGHEALARIDEALPDGMILDLMMPEMDGFEVLRTIRGTEKAGRLPVLILTAKHVTRDELSFLKGNHVHQLIQKGDVSRNDLLAAVSRMVMPAPERAAVLPPRGRTRRTCEGTPRVLVVEDNPGNMQPMRALLQETCLLAEAANGQECLEEARRQRPD